MRTVILSLKWGVLKSILIENCDEAEKLYNRYEQVDEEVVKDKELIKKDIICQLIDLSTKDMILLDFYDEYVSKEDAKKYVKDYLR